MNKHLSQDPNLIFSLSPIYLVLIFNRYIININKAEQKELGEKIYQKLRQERIDVILDDRKERAGVKFNDRDLIGIPYRITVGKDAADDIVEYSTRKDMENEKISSSEAIGKIVDSIKKDLSFK